MIDAAHLENDFEQPALPSFVCLDANGTLDMWNPTARTGDTATDFKLGGQHAATVVEMARLNGDRSLIGWTLDAIARKGFVGSLERGFIDAIASRAYVGSHN